LRIALLFYQFRFAFAAQHFKFARSTMPPGIHRNATTNKSLLLLFDEKIAGNTIFIKRLKSYNSKTFCEEYNVG
jgi:hypothetical protein